MSTDSEDNHVNAIAGTGHVTVAAVTAVLETLYPLAWAEDWDRVGLVAGDPHWDVTRLRLAVDPTVAEAAAAASQPGTMLITHHPLLLKGANFLPANTGKGRVATELIRAGGALWCGHTNADRSSAGTIGAWIDHLGLKDPAPIVPAAERPSVGGPQSGQTSTQVGLGAIGRLSEPTTVGELARTIAQFAPATAQGVLHTGGADRPVRTVAVCPGAGDSFLETVASSEADVYVTSDLRHHPALEHLEMRADPEAVPALIDLPHYASEFLYLPTLAKELSAAFPDLPVDVSDISSDPFTGAAR